MSVKLWIIVSETITIEKFLTKFLVRVEFRCVFEYSFIRRINKKTEAGYVSEQENKNFLKNMRSDRPGGRRGHFFGCWGTEPIYGASALGLSAC